MKKPKLREIVEALKALAFGPYTSKFPKEEAVIRKEFRGAPEWREDKCIGCGACAEVCPAKAIEYEDIIKSDGTSKRVFKRFYDNCIYCGQCGALCTTGEGIEYTTKWNLAQFKREDLIETNEKELAVCQHCGGPVTAWDHLKWLRPRVGHIAYSNPTILLASYKDLGLIDSVTPDGETTDVDRPDFMRVLCPNCRRAAILTEEWGA
jgi:hydrogenase-4 component H